MLSIFLHRKELYTLKDHTLISTKLFKYLEDQFLQAGKNRKRIKLNITIEQLDELISYIADKSNMKNSDEQKQLNLDRMFGRFAEIYNNSTDNE